MIYPITRGLLVSAAYRYDHSYGLDKSDDFCMSSGHTNSSRIAIVLKMGELYFKLSNNEYFSNLPEMQQIINLKVYGSVIEEFTGKGFYHPELEARYAKECPFEINIENGLLVCRLG